MDSLLGSLRGLARRALGVWRNFFDAFVRDNKVLPPVAALLALFLFAWVVAGAFVDEQDGGNPGEANLVQSGNQQNAPPISPESEDRDADSFAAYRNKDPFRRLLAPASAAPEQTTDDPTADASPPAETTTGTGNGGNNGAGNGAGNGGAGGGGRSRGDSDGDGIPNRREERLGLDPRNRDTDGDGTPDGSDDSDGDGVRDGRGSGAGGAGGGAGGTGSGAGSGAGGGPGGAGGGRGDGDDLLDSGGIPGYR